MSDYVAIIISVIFAVFMVCVHLPEGKAKNTRISRLWRSDKFAIANGCILGVLSGFILYLSGYALERYYLISIINDLVKAMCGIVSGCPANLTAPVPTIPLLFIYLGTVEGAAGIVVSTILFVVIASRRGLVRAMAEGKTESSQATQPNNLALLSCCSG